MLLLRVAIYSVKFVLARKLGFIGRGCFIGKIKTSQGEHLCCRWDDAVVGLLFDEGPEAGLGFGEG
ncbi:MAG: hypothetical protein EBQ97_06940, partial [Bacteroidetes bacterium]|nr:hypothetical protein [Bacteroidota bacterium]